MTYQGKTKNFLLPKKSKSLLFPIFLILCIYCLISQSKGSSTGSKGSSSGSTGSTEATCKITGLNKRSLDYTQWIAENDTTTSITSSSIILNKCTKPTVAAVGKIRYVRRVKIVNDFHIHLEINIKGSTDSTGYFPLDGFTVILGKNQDGLFNPNQLSGGEILYSNLTKIILTEFDYYYNSEYGDPDDVSNTYSNFKPHAIIRNCLNQTCFANISHEGYTNISIYSKESGENITVDFVYKADTKKISLYINDVEDPILNNTIEKLFSGFDWQSEIDSFKVYLGMGCRMAYVTEVSLKNAFICEEKDSATSYILTSVSEKNNRTTFTADERIELYHCFSEVKYAKYYDADLKVINGEHVGTVLENGFNDSTLDDKCSFSLIENCNQSGNYILYYDDSFEAGQFEFTITHGVFDKIKFDSELNVEVLNESAKIIRGGKILPNKDYLFDEFKTNKYLEIDFYAYDKYDNPIIDLNISKSDELKEYFNLIITKNHSNQMDIEVVEKNKSNGLYTLKVEISSIGEYTIQSKYLENNITHYIIIYNKILSENSTCQIQNSNSDSLNVGYICYLYDYLGNQITKSSYESTYKSLIDIDIIVTNLNTSSKQLGSNSSSITVDVFQSNNYVSATYTKDSQGIIEINGGFKLKNETEYSYLTSTNSNNDNNNNNNNNNNDNDSGNKIIIENCKTINYKYAIYPEFKCTNSCSSPYEYTYTSENNISFCASSCPKSHKYLNETSKECITTCTEYVLDGTKCVSECPEVYTTCTKCLDGYFTIDGQCLNCKNQSKYIEIDGTECIDKPTTPHYIIDEDQNVFKFCEEKCDSCNETDCITCRKGYMANGSRCDLDENYYLVNANITYDNETIIREAIDLIEYKSIELLNDKDIKFFNDYCLHYEYNRKDTTIEDRRFLFYKIWDGCLFASDYKENDTNLDLICLKNKSNTLIDDEENNDTKIHILNNLNSNRNKNVLEDFKDKVKSSISNFKILNCFNLKLKIIDKVPFWVTSLSLIGQLSMTILFFLKHYKVLLSFFSNRHDSRIKKEQISIGINNPPIKKDKKITNTSINTFNKSNVDELKNNSKSKSISEDFNDKSDEAYINKNILNIKNKNFLSLYINTIKNNLPILNIFLGKNKFYPPSLKIIRVILNFNFGYFMNTLLLNEKYITNRLKSTKTNLIYELPKSIFSSLLMLVFDILLSYLNYPQFNLFKMFNRKERSIRFLKKSIKFIFWFKILLSLNFILTYASMLIFWIFTVTYSCVYPNEQIDILIESLISFILFYALLLVIFLLFGFVKYLLIKNKYLKVIYYLPY